ncbi:hypothetical protein TRSC58_07527 [Trypanosoma rangeli SC58]|uniref:Uncharacterized protein n=1 Tax=Trypanosoma rangeli SC58 TaxID=429131 RepID=A0A061ISZ2_TRYRA|nr:hypothetical protein TRSC58_07527 [Trypanosoma rangeli SC58]
MFLRHCEHHLYCFFFFLVVVDIHRGAVFSPFDISFFVFRSTPRFFPGTLPAVATGAEKGACISAVFVAVSRRLRGLVEGEGRVGRGCIYTHSVAPFIRCLLLRYFCLCAWGGAKMSLPSRTCHAAL